MRFWSRWCAVRQLVQRRLPALLKFEIVIRIAVVPELGKVARMTTAIRLPIEALDHDPIVLEAGLGGSEAMLQEHCQEHERPRGFEVWIASSSMTLQGVSIPRFPKAASSGTLSRNLHI